MMVTLHINYLNIPHKDTGKVLAMITYIEYIYDPTTVKKENKHTYLGIYMGFTENRKFEASMTVYINEAVGEFPKDTTTPVTSTVAECILKINKNGKLPFEERDILFHRTFKNMLFVINIARQDINPSINGITNDQGSRSRLGLL